MPLISIIVPCYNQAQYLDECLQSVLDQTFQDWECIIVNDGSPDNTEKVAKKWVEKDGRFRYVHKENGGLSSARNFGIDKAEGAWILPLDCDDKIECDYLKSSSKHFSKKYMVIYCKARKFGAENKDWEIEPFSLPRLANDNLIFCSALFKKCDWQRVGGYDENFIYGLEDWDFWINILKDGGEVFRIDKIHFFYRIKEKSMIKNIKSKKNLEDKMIRYLESKHYEFFSTHLGTIRDNHKWKEKAIKIYNSKIYKIYSWIIKVLKTSS